MSQALTPVLTQIDPHGVAKLTLNRPENHNAVDDAMIAAINSALPILEQDPKVKILVLNAQGKSFCAGGVGEGTGPGTTLAGGTKGHRPYL